MPKRRSLARQLRRLIPRVPTCQGRKARRPRPRNSFAQLHGGPRRARQTPRPTGADSDGCCPAPSPSVPSHPVSLSAFGPGGKFSFCFWASALVRLVLKSGTAFAHFLASSLPIRRDPSLIIPLRSVSSSTFSHRGHEGGLVGSDCPTA